MAGKKFLFSLRVVQQRLAQPRPWGHQQVGEFTAFDNLALFQQRRVVTDGFHHLQLVRNQHNGQIEALAKDLTSPQVAEFIRKTYNGSVIPVAPQS